MATATNKSKKQRKHTRPAGTSSLSEPVIAESASFATLSAFSPSADLFAHISLAVDKHRLRILNTATGKVVSETIFPTSRVTSIRWIDANISNKELKRKRKRRKSTATSEKPAHVSPRELFLALGLSNGTVALFSPTQGEVTRTLTDPRSTTAVLSIAYGKAPSGDEGLWTSSANGSLYSWSLPYRNLIGSWKSAGTTALSALSSRPFVASEDEENEEPTSSSSDAEILVAHHNIRLVRAALSKENESSELKIKELATFTGHASTILSLEWAPVTTSSDGTSSTSTVFASIAEGDRFVSIWKVPTIDEPNTSPQGAMIASFPLDTDIRSVAFSPSSQSSQPSVLALSSSGSLLVFPLPSLHSSPSKKQRLATAPGGTSISAVSSQIISAIFLADHGKIRIARLSEGVKLTFETINFFTEDGKYTPEIKLKNVSLDSAGLLAASSTEEIVQVKRYQEPKSVAIRSGNELPLENGMELDETVPEGQLDAELAELSLGQRLGRVAPDIPAPISSEKTQKDASQPLAGVALNRKPDAITMTRTLIQALHSSDEKLLETVLEHSSQTLIRNTVRGLPPQLAMPLLSECVKRLNRGNRGGTGKGRGGGASSQRGELMVRWIRAVLIGHTAHLMTIPDLVARLSALHTTLTTRLTLQDRLLSLNGRLDLVISQIELRSSDGPAPLSGPGANSANAKEGSSGKFQKRKGRAIATRYVEGQSESEGEASDAEPEIEMDVDDGDVEDVELGGNSEESDSEGEDDSATDGEEVDDDEEGQGEDGESGSDGDDDEDEDDEDEAPRANGFLDMEAEESSDDGESEESED